MHQYILTVQNERKGKKLIDFLQQLDFVSLKDNEFSKMETDIKKSVNELKDGKTSSWKEKKIQLKHD